MQTRRTRHHARPSIIQTDDLGVLREGDESTEDLLRRQLLEREREIDRLKLTVQTLQDQLSQRPPVEQVQKLQQEFKNLELILQGTQRENEKCMVDLERQKLREKMLERELTRLAGDNWQTNLEITPLQPTSANPLRSGANLHHRSNTIGSLPASFRSSNSQSPPPLIRSHRKQNSQNQSSPLDEHALEGQEKEARHRQAQAAHLEQLKLLILGMEQRLEVREEKLTKTVEHAENEGKRYEVAAAAAQNLVAASVGAH